MKNEIVIPVQQGELKEEDIISAAERRKKYSVIRDLQAKEYNDAIASRLEKEKENAEENLKEE